MTKFLYANGCSWTAGNGIEYDPSLSNLDLSDRADMWKHVREHAWPSVLSKKLGCEQFTNDAIGAGSNKRMVRTTCNFIQGCSKEMYGDLVVVLGWTTTDRDEIYMEEDGKGQWIVFNCTQAVSEHKPPFSKNYIREVDNFQKRYITHVYNQRTNFLYFFQQMFLMSNMLENLGIKYLFFSSLPWDWTFSSGVDPRKEFPVQIQNLKKPAIINMVDNKYRTMLDFCVETGVPMAPDHHTMIDGHNKWAEYLHSKLQDLYQL
jgi:hypothetical protein